MNLALHVFVWTLLAAGFALFVLYIVELWASFYRDWKDAGAARRGSQRTAGGSSSQSPLRGSPVADFFDESNEGDAA
jgi:hypothetical protein